MKYLVVVEKGPKSYGAFVPDLPAALRRRQQRAKFAN
jgi:hypothetical protein